MPSKEMVKTKTYCIAQRRKGAEKTITQIWARFARKPNNKGPLGFNAAQRETIRGFPAELDFSFGPSLKEDVSAPQRLRARTRFLGVRGLKETNQKQTNASRGDAKAQRKP